MRDFIEPVRTSVAALLMLMAITGAAIAGPREDALAAFDRGDFATALRLWNSLADSGDAEAQNNLGVMYRDGLGVKQSDEEAHRLFGLAAAKGLAVAQYNLAVIYARGFL
jgi:uncharacterized protein